MSSQEDDPSQSGAYKKRRGPACDKCRSKKVRCNGRPGEPCNNCIAGNLDCTYVTNAKKRYPDLARVEELEGQLANMKKLLNKLHPGVDFTPALNGYVDSNSLWMVDPADPKLAKTIDKSMQFAPPRPVLAKPDIHPDDLDPSDDDESHPSFLERSFKAMSLQTGPSHFLGKSSRFFFFKKAFMYKYENAGVEPPNSRERNPWPWKKDASELWTHHPWIIPVLQIRESHHYSFPDADLMSSLVDLFFENTVKYLPMLHRPTFEQQLKSGLHFTDEGFGSVMLLVCALGSRFSDDPRVLQNNTDSWFSSGWKWFCQVQINRKLIILRPPRLYDLQLCCLAGLYLHQSVLSQMAWGVVGHGLRIAQEMGAHRQKRYGRKPTVDGELMKRAFWVLMALDGALCASFGRTCVLQEEDYDTDFPIECDDEHWVDADGNEVFKQPENSPSKTAFFNSFLRLKRIHVFALRTVYAINRSKVALGWMGPQWEQDIVSEIDSALNAWVDSVPDFLRWDPHRENLMFFDQSVFLWTAYYNLQINIHRAFIPSAGKPSPMSFSSLAICTNAARSSIHMLEIQFNRSKSGALAAPSQNVLFTSAIVLLLNIWGNKRRAEPNKDMEEVLKALKMLQSMQRRWYAAKRFSEVLYDLANVGDIPLPQTRAAATKRPRSSEQKSTSPKALETSADTTGEPRPIASSRRFHTFQQAHSPATSSSSHSEPSHRPGISVASQPNPDRATLDSFPPLSGQAGLWPSSSTVTTSEGDPFEPSIFTSMSATSNGTFEPVVGQQETQSFPALDQNPPFSHDFSSNNYSSNPAFVDCAGSSSAYTLPLNSAPGFGAIQSSESDTLAMWSFAPTGFEWDDWDTYATNMTEFAGQHGDMMNPANIPTSPP